MRNFILPGGSIASAALHLARTSCRLLERKMLNIIENHNNLDDQQVIIVSEIVLRYVNRLSDYFFMAARYANHLLGVEDIPWKGLT